VEPFTHATAAPSRDEDALAHALARDLRRRFDASRWVPSLTVRATARNALSTSPTLFDPFDERTRITVPNGFTLELRVQWNLDPAAPRVVLGDAP
jgi:hypothetical protein